MPRIAATTDQLNEPVARNAGTTSIDETVVRDIGQLGSQPFERFKAELQHAFAVPDHGSTPLTAAEVVARSEH